MSKFNNYLKEMINKSGCTIYSIANNIQCDRSNLTNQINGKRKMTKEVLFKTLDFISITDKSKETLLDLYNKEILGDDYEVLTTVMNAFDRYKNMLSNNNFPNINIKESVPNTLTTEINSFNEIIHSIHAIVSKEITQNEPIIYFNFSLNNEHISSIIQNAYNSINNKYFVKSIMSFSLNNNETTNNFLKIMDMLPLLINGLQPYYYFSDNDETCSLNLFPFYLICNNMTLLISRDFDKAISITDKTIINTYKNEFENQIRSYKRFDFEATSFLNIPYILNKSMSIDETPVLYGINESFGVIPFLSQEQLHRVFSEKVINCDEIIAELQRSYSSVEHFYSYTPVGTLMDFVNTGTEDCINNDYSNPLSIEDRIEALERIKAYISNGGNYFFINKNASNINSLTFNIMSESKLLVFNYSNRQDTNTMYVISAYNGAFKILKRFFEVLHKSSMILTNEEAISALDNGINAAKQLLNS